MKKTTKKQLFALFVLFTFMGSTIAIAVTSSLLPPKQEQETVYTTTLIIYIRGQEITLPDNTGNVHFGTENYAEDSLIHFYDNESYTLGDFFVALHIVFDSECLHTYCTDDEGTLRMYVNNIENLEFENYTIKSNDMIEIDYSRF